MPTKSAVAMAIQITPQNSDKIAIVNGGVAPHCEGFYTGSYFIKPYDPSLENSIVPGYIFEQNWKFIGLPTPKHFVDIVEI